MGLWGQLQAGVLPPQSLRVRHRHTPLGPGPPLQTAGIMRLQMNKTERNMFKDFVKHNSAVFEDLNYFFPLFIEALTQRAFPVLV